MAENIADKAKRMIENDPALLGDMNKGWNTICDAIEKRALAQRPKPRSFEVHHVLEVARKTYLTAVVDGKNILEAESAAMTAVGF